MPRFRMTIAYDGSDFHGWQKQHPPGQEPLRTVQGVVEQAVQDVVRQQVHVVGASRTDSGVHALGQVAIFDADPAIPVDRMKRAINTRLPEDVQVRDIAIAADDFDPIKHCVSKGYRYTIQHSVNADTNLRPLFERHRVFWTVYSLDVPRMNQAAAHLVGTHDFASLTRLNHGRESTVRTVDECRVTERSETACEIDISGNGFLYNMVRIVAGTLVEVGRGKFEPEDIPRILHAKDRAAAGPTLPPEGLCLMWIRYAVDS